MCSDINFKTFSKKYWYIYIILFVFLVAPPIVFICCFDDPSNAGAWGSLLAGISTYLGAAFLGVIVFYHSWTQQCVTENLNKITVIFAFNAEHNGEWYVPYSFSKVKMDKFKYVDSRSSESRNGYLYFSVTNINERIACSIDFISMYYSFGQKIEEYNKYDLYTDLPLIEPLDYKKRLTGFIGGGLNVFDFEYYKKSSKVDYYFVFRITSLKQDKYYVIIHFYLGKDRDFECSYISEKEYNKRIKKFGNPLESNKKKK